MTDDIERIARAMDPLAWVEYGDRNHRAITLIHAKAAIPAVIDALVRRAEDAAGPKGGMWAKDVAEWLRKQTEDMTR